MMNFLFTQTPLMYLVQSFWHDEAFSYLLAKKNILEIIFLAAKDFNPPLYYLLLHFWLKIFGSSEISMRSLSIVFYWGTIYVIFLFLTKIFKIKFRSSIFYLLLFIINPLLTYYAFESRMYTMLAFFATLSFYFFEKKDWKFYIISTILGLFTHYFMILAILAQGTYFYLTIKGKNKRLELLKKVILPFLFFIPWIFFVLTQNNIFNGSFWIKSFNFNDIFNTFGMIYTGYEKDFSFYNKEIFKISSLILIILFIGFVKIYKQKSSNKHLELLLILWSVAIPLTIAFLSLFKPIFLPRYLIFNTVGLLLFIVLILEKMKTTSKIFFLALIIYFTISYQVFQMIFRTKTNLGKTIREIGKLAKPNDLLLTNERNFFTAKYYFKDGKKVFIYGKTYEELPKYIGKVLIDKKDLVSSLPYYPVKAFILKSDGSYDIQALH